ncbi:MAG: PE-PPE domain-containing protein [Mycobacterium sp.]
MSRGQLKRAVAPAVVGGAALMTAAAVAFTTTVPQVVSRDSVELTATVTPGSATNWNADGIDRFYGIDWNATYGPTAIAPFRLVEFWQGPENILKALSAAQTDGKPDVVVSSGRGAGNASAAITWLALTNRDDPRLTETLWILDNNVDRPNGGYAARYPFFAFVGVNPVPVPNDLEGVQILDVGYQYAWNSSAPTYISNLPALLNAIIAYGYRYRQQEKLPIPTEILRADGTLNPEASGHYIIGTDGQIVDHKPLPDRVTTVYVTYQTDDLPMLRPIRDFGGDLGNAFADVVEPLLTVLVNASYTNNDPLSDPSVYTPMQLFAPPHVWFTAAQQLPGAIAEGWQRLQEHLGGVERIGTTATTQAAPDAPLAETVSAVEAEPVQDKPAKNEPVNDEPVEKSAPAGTAETSDTDTDSRAAARNAKRQAVTRDTDKADTAERPDRTTRDSDDTSTTPKRPSKADKADKPAKADKHSAAQ